MTKNRIFKILILLSYLIIFLLFFVFDLKCKCIFKDIFGIACPGCGLTRSFDAILSFNFLEAIKYNILGIPIFVLAIISAIIFVKELFIDENKLIPWILKKLQKYYWLIILILIVTIIINNINSI